MAHHNVTRVAQAPIWFDLVKYDNLRDLSLVGWFEQLSIRSALLSGNLTSKNYTRLVQATRDMGVAQLSLTRIEEVPLPSKWTDEGFRTNSARLLTCDDVANFWLSNDVLKAYYADGKTELFADRDYYYKALKPYDLYTAERSESINGKHIHIAIDLASSDSVIKEDIENIIAAARKKLDIPPSFKGTKPIQVGKWFEQRIIPFLDIKIWMKEEDRDLERATLMEWIFKDIPDEKRPDFRTVRDNADYCISPETLREFLLLAPDL